jgi:hypothetical protein
MLVATLIATPVAAAGAFEVDSLRDSCTTTAGHHGYGRLIFRVRGVEIGETGTTYIRAIPTAQRWSGSRWIWIYELPFAQSLRFPDDAATYSVDFDAVRWDITRSERTYKHRLKFTVQFWSSRRGPDKLVRTVIRYSRAC